MSNDVIEQTDEATPVLIRFGRCTARPLSALKPTWQGETPAGVENILTRSALRPGYRDHYAKWASNFALLDDAYLAEIFRRAPGTLSEIKLHPWQTLPWVNSHYCPVPGDYLWVQDQLQGCTIELCYPGDDPDVRLLAIEGMSVMCSDAVGAARLALASYPTATAALTWASYW